MPERTAMYALCGAVEQLILFCSKFDLQERLEMKKFFVAIVVLMSFMLFPGTVCEAFEEEPKEDSFSSWYEENKNNDGAIFELKDMEVCRDEPVVLDGTGKITIDCGEYGFVVGCTMTIDNPNLTIKGHGDFVFLANSHSSQLMLRRGEVNYEGGGKGIIATGGSITSGCDGADSFFIHASGANPTAVFLGTMDACSFQGVRILAEGDGRANGIYGTRGNKTEVRDCSIEVSGTEVAYGIDVNGELVIENTSVTAVCSSGKGHAFSVSGSAVIWKNCSFVPEYRTGEEYVIIDYDPPAPIVRTGEEGEDAELPCGLMSYVENRRTGEITKIEIPVLWQREKQVEGDNICVVVKGQFNTDGFQEVYDTKEDLVPKVTVFTAPDKKLFLISYEVLNREAGKTNLLLLVPYPWEASAAYLEYGEDGEDFTRYNVAGNTNLISPQESFIPDWIYGFKVELPTDADTIYLKMVAEGGSFDGESKVWKICRDSDQTIPEGMGGDMDGDRGGQIIAPGAVEDEQGMDTTSAVQENQEAEGTGAVEDKTREEWLKRKQENEQKENHQPAAGIQSDREQQEEAPPENRKDFGEHGGLYAEENPAGEPADRKSYNPAGLLAGGILILFLVIFFIKYCAGTKRR